MTELSEHLGIPKRTLRYWVKKRLISRPRGRGRSARYSESDLARARIVQNLRSQKRPLSEIASDVKRLSSTELAALARPQPTVAPTKLPTSRERNGDASHFPVPYSQWQLVQLMPKLVLFLGADAEPQVTAKAGEIVKLFASNSGPFE